MNHLPSDQKDILDKKIVEFVIHGLCPLSIVDYQKFCELVHALKPSYNPPSRRALKRKIEQYQSIVMSSIKTIILNEIELGNKITIVIDMWTDRLQKPFGGMFVFFIDANLTIQKKLLSFSYFPESHSAPNISDWINSVLESYSIHRNDISAAVTDNAANMRATFHNEITEISNYFCVAHTLQLVVTNSINDSNGISNVLKKVQSIVSYFRRSWKASVNLVNVQTGLLDFSKALVLIPDVQTRWS